MERNSRPKSLVDALRAVYGPGYRPCHPIAKRNEQNAFQIDANAPRIRSVNTAPSESFESEDDHFDGDVDDEEVDDEVVDDDDENTVESIEQSPPSGFFSARQQLKTSLQNQSGNQYLRTGSNYEGKDGDVNGKWDGFDDTSSAPVLMFFLYRFDRSILENQLYNQSKIRLEIIGIR